jgi:hypothetical protein
MKNKNKNQKKETGKGPIFFFFFCKLLTFMWDFLRQMSAMSISLLEYQCDYRGKILFQFILL